MYTYMCTFVHVCAYVLVQIDTWIHCRDALIHVLALLLQLNQ